MFILKDDFLDDIDSFAPMREAFSKYRNYLKVNKDKFTPEIYDFAIEQSIEDVNNRNFLHDAWLKKVEINEIFDENDEARKINISLTFLGSYHDRYLQLTYHDVRSYFIKSDELFSGHGDFFRGELRLSDCDGCYIHEFDWASSDRWKIEFSQFSYNVHLKSIEETK